MTAKKRNRREGDTIQVALSSQYRYLQYVGKTKHGIDVFRVVDLSATNPIVDVAKIGEQKTSYWLLSLCRVLVEDQRFTYVGNDPSGGEIPPLRRRFAGGWIILYNGQEQFVQTPIDDETSRISLEEILPAEEIVQRLQSAWRPEDAREDMGTFVRRTVEEARSVRHQNRRETTFFVEFSATLNLAKAKKEIKGHGFDVSVEPRSRSLAVTKRWKSGDTLDTMNVIEAELIAISKRYGGKLTGRETAV